MKNRLTLYSALASPNIEETTKSKICFIFYIINNKQTRNNKTQSIYIKIYIYKYIFKFQF